MALMSAAEIETVRAELSRRNSLSTGSVSRVGALQVMEDLDKMIDSRVATDVRDATAKSDFSEVLMLDYIIAIANARRIKAMGR